MMTFQNNTPRCTRGFTLIELLIVITILGLLLAFVLPQYGTMQARARLNRTADQLVQILEQARTMSISGFKHNANGTEVDMVGVYLLAGSNRLTLFSRPYSEELGTPVFTSASRVLSTVLTGDIIVRNITANTTQSLAEPVILFSPPLGLAQVHENNAVQGNNNSSHIQQLDITVGVGSTDNPLQKTVRFFTTTNRLEITND